MLSAIEREDDNINRQFQKKRSFIYSFGNIRKNQFVWIKNYVKKLAGHFNHIRCTIIKIRNNRLKNVSIFFKISQI